MSGYSDDNVVLFSGSQYLFNPLLDMRKYVESL